MVVLSQVIVPLAFLLDLGALVFDMVISVCLKYTIISRAGDDLVNFF